MNNLNLQQKPEPMKPETLKKIKDEAAITLTKEELIGLIDDAMAAGKNWAETYQGWFMPTQDQHKEKFDEFLKSKGLTK